MVKIEKEEKKKKVTIPSFKVIEQNERKEISIEDLLAGESNTKEVESLLEGLINTGIEEVENDRK